MTQTFGSVFEPEKWQPIFDALGNEGGIEGVDLGRGFVPGQPFGNTPKLVVTTIDAGEVCRRVKAGADSWDVIEAHTTWIWFTSREAWFFAWRMARCLKRGGRFDVATPPRLLTEALEGTLWVDPAPQHMAGAA